MSADVRPFSPTFSSTVVLAATTASNTAIFQNTTASGARNVRVYNSGPNDCAIEFGPSPTATFPVGSTGSSMVISAGSVEIFSARSSQIAGICTGSSASATLYITPGEGV